MTTTTQRRKLPSLKRDKPSRWSVTSVARGSETTTWPASTQAKRTSSAGKTRSSTDTRLYCSEHTDFSESTEAMAVLTEDEKKAKLDELRERLKAKRAVQSVQDKEESKRNEVRPFALPSLKTNPH